MVFFNTATLLLLASVFEVAQSHGYLASPRSRNFIAWEDGVSWGGGDDTYSKDSCPHCLNRGGTLAQCGTNGGSKNYDYPLSYTGNLMPADPQAQYAMGQEIDVDILLTAHHMGHFEFFACPIQHGEKPSGDCFEDHPLEFVKDPLYGAPKDPNYPNRAYIAPRGVATNDQVGMSGDFYSFRLKLPDNVSGELVLLQWHYLTANSCTFPGYDVYPFPANWGNMGNSLGLCGTLPPDGNGVPEQFWNCAEISISDGPVPPSFPAPFPAPSPPTPPEPTTPAPVVDTTPTTPSPVIDRPEWEDWVLSTEMRCGSSEADARGNCRQTCSSIDDCHGAAGQWCWPVYDNFCGSKPEPTECNAEMDRQARCGLSELVARETCGKPCEVWSDCDGTLGENCHALHPNACDCHVTRKLRGSTTSK